MHSESSPLHPLCTFYQEALLHACGGWRAAVGTVISSGHAIPKGGRARMEGGQEGNGNMAHGQ
jgi:hypothetical protein